jgi:Txe/YoeB family toxin of toxin-antitoxin system
MIYTLIYHKKTVADKQKLKASKLLQKAETLCNALSINPIPLNSKELSFDLKGKRSIRINLQHRLVYEVFEKEKIVKIFRMWGHYEK